MHSTAATDSEARMSLPGDDEPAWGPGTPVPRAKHRSLVEVSGVFDRLAIVGMLAGLRERLAA